MLFLDRTVCFSNGTILDGKIYISLYMFAVVRSYQTTRQNFVPVRFWMEQVYLRSVYKRKSFDICENETKKWKLFIRNTSDTCTISLNHCETTFIGQMIKQGNLWETTKNNSRFITVPILLHWAPWYAEGHLQRKVKRIMKHALLNHELLKKTFMPDCSVFCLQM